MNRHVVMRLLLVLSVLMFVVPAARAQDRVGVINVGLVYAQLRESESIRVAFATRAQEVRNAEQTLQAKLQQLVTERDTLYRPGTPEHNQRTFDIAKQQSEGQFQIQFQQSELIGGYRTQTNQLFQKIYTATEAVAKERGFTVVVADAQPLISAEEVARLNPQEFVALLASARSVIYRADDVDLTNAVLTKMNAEYESAGAATQPATTPTP